MTVDLVLFLIQKHFFPKKDIKSYDSKAKLLKLTFPLYQDMRISFRTHLSVISSCSQPALRQSRLSSAGVSRPWWRAPIEEEEDDERRP